MKIVSHLLAMGALVACLCGCGSPTDEKASRGKPPQPGSNADPDTARRPTMAGNEAHAIGSMRAYASAQTMFKRMDWDKDKTLEYATPFSQLHYCDDGTGDPIDLLSVSMAVATSKAKPHHGYFFRDLKSINGRPIDWKQDYGLCAIPVKRWETGVRTFIVTTDGQVWAKILADGKIVTDFPADPATDDWDKAE